MKVVARTLWLPKRGNSNDEYEDAAFPTDCVEETTNLFRCAVADGATETSFARYWAQLLVEGYVKQISMDELKSRWNESISQKSLPWYAEEKAESGAYAALVGLTLTEEADGEGTWSSEALGDSCLFHVRDNRVTRMFPLKKSADFNSRPVLLSSNAGEDADTEKHWKKEEGKFKHGDKFYLLSDAIACWMMKREEEDGDAASFLASLTSQELLTAFSELQRENIDDEGRPMMRNDDVTLMEILI